MYLSKFENQWQRGKVCPGRGSASGSPRRGPDISGGAGQVGVDFLGLGVSRGGAPLVLERAGRVGLSFAKTETYCMLKASCAMCKKKKDSKLFQSKSSFLSQG